jgi:ubiquinone/menaquinone biosynthesis C-methylase UbiE
MSAVPEESVDATFMCQPIEHLYPHEVPIALKEFMRVPKSEGFTVITCFTYQNFPGRFKHLAPALVREGRKLLAGTKTIIVRKILFDMSFFYPQPFC